MKFPIFLGDDETGDQFQWLGQNCTASESLRPPDGEWGRWDWNWGLSDPKVHPLRLKVSYSPALDLTITLWPLQTHPGS